MLQAADREKQFVAQISIAAAGGLAGAKLGVGLATNSLGILSEAAHSGLDLVAAIMAWLAVRVSSRPADSTHSYGHGKVENLSALFQTLLLFGTCIWIILEAIERLVWYKVEAEPSIWAFGVIMGSIAVDALLFRKLAQVARNHNSQSLEAGALHFSTDIWSSVVVLIGLALLWLGNRTGLSWLRYADTVAALSVAIIAIWMSLKLGRRTIADLLDEVPPGLSDKIAATLRLPGVVRISRVRVRRSGSDLFVDTELYVEETISFVQSCAIADTAKQKVQHVLPGADVIVHVEPVAKRQ